MNATYKSDSAVLNLAGRHVGRGHAAYFIAEIGSNHDGSLDTARRMIAAAARAGANAVKFQSFTAAGLTIPSSPAYPILENLTLPEDWHKPLADEARAQGVDFMSTPFEEQRVDLLESLDVSAFKVASGDMTHHPLLRHMARLGRPMIVSTGLASLDEVASAVDVIRSEGNSQIALLHCVACYPPEFDDMNLRAIATLEQEFGTVVGFSDHTPGHGLVVAARALGATVFEKHVTFDRDSDGPDHFYAMTIEEFGAMVAEVRLVERALGSGQKVPPENESGGRVGGRRSLYASEPIAKGTKVTGDMLKIVRPADGLSPSDITNVIGRVAARDIATDECIQWKDLG